MKDQIFNSKAKAAILAVLMFFTSSIPAGVFAGSNTAVTADIQVTYKVEGNAETAGGDRVILTADDPSSPMPGGTDGGKKTITMRDEGTYSFGSIHYKEPGVHWYTVTRELTKKKGVTKDRSAYRVKVVALNDGRGYVLVFKEGSDEKSELTYVDRVAPETGDTGRVLIYGIMMFSAAALLAASAVLRIRNKRKEVRNV